MVSGSTSYFFLPLTSSDMPVSLHLLPTFEHNGESGAICLEVVVVDVLSLQATDILRD
jgi:hypothetical protein